MPRFRCKNVCALFQRHTPLIGSKFRAVFCHVPGVCLHRMLQAGNVDGLATSVTSRHAILLCWECACTVLFSIATFQLSICNNLQKWYLRFCQTPTGPLQTLPFGLLMQHKRERKATFICSDGIGLWYVLTAPRMGPDFMYLCLCDWRLAIRMLPAVVPSYVNLSAVI